VPEQNATGTQQHEQRLDALLAARGLVRSRTAAAKLVQAGRVLVDGRAVVKPSASVRADAALEVDHEDEWVSRAARKLVGALDTFAVDPSGRVVLDVGASTGGFTQVLLARGAERVVALDVGHGQLDPVVRQDRRVVVVEGCNARSLTSGEYDSFDPAASRTSLVVGDLSFISLTLVLPALADAVPAEEYVLLVKPQFEVGRTGIREGIVHDPALRQDAVMGVLWAAWDLGFGTAGVAESAIVGTHGNHEYVAHLTRNSDAPRSLTANPAESPVPHGSNPTEWIDRMTDLTGGAR
jgi:23S rRNA (cytidine1920-2'-O)/16S rRNA (cytidine1409-2'-O)-methyltransferase